MIEIAVAIITIILHPFKLIIALFITKLYWDDSICKKCKSGRNYIKSYNSDRYFPYIYGCDKCSFEFKSVIKYDEISDAEIEAKIRDKKISKILK